MCDVYASYPVVHPSLDCVAVAARGFAECSNTSTCGDIGDCFAVLVAAAFECEESPAGVEEEVEAKCGA